MLVGRLKSLFDILLLNCLSRENNQTPMFSQNVNDGKTRFQSYFASNPVIIIFISKAKGNLKQPKYQNQREKSKDRCRS